MYPTEIEQIPERFFKQAYETVYDNLDTVADSNTLNAFNKRVDRGGYCPTLTTRCEGFKTAIVVVRMYED